MTSLIPTLTHPRDDTPAVYALAPGQPVYAADVGIHEAEALAELMEETLRSRMLRRRLPGDTSP